MRTDAAAAIDARLRRDPVAKGAALGALGVTLLVLLAALIGATIRLLPWVLDPAIAWSTLSPFAKSLLAVAFEAALMTGWPVGWALAIQRLVERGEARVLASLGESPARTVARLVPQGIGFAAVLVVASLFLAREAAAPGRVVNALLTEGRLSCADSVARGRAPSTRGIPFVSVTWLCAHEARLVGRAPVGGVVFTADDARVSDDLRRIELDGARIALPASAATTIRVRVDSLVLRGLSPWARASALPPVIRAIVVAASAFGTAWMAALAILRARRRRIGGVAAAAIGAAGPLSALAMLRALELRIPESASLSPGWLVLFGIVPVVAAGFVFGTTALVTALPEARSADSK